MVVKLQVISREPENTAYNLLEKVLPHNYPTLWRSLLAVMVCLGACPSSSDFGKSVFVVRLAISFVCVWGNTNRRRARYWHFIIVCFVAPRGLLEILSVNKNVRNQLP